MSQGGPKSSVGSGADPVETLTGNTGGAVPPTAFNIDILGNNTTGIDIAGTPGSSLLTVIGLAASTTQMGTVELATDAETIAYFSTSLAITPSNLTAAFASPQPIGSTTPNTAIFTLLDVDNIEINGNTISSTDVNGNISMEPNGTGALVVPSNNLYVGSASPGNPYNISIEAATAGLIGESIQNTSNNAAAGANLQLIVEPATADAFTLYDVNGATTFSTGIDNSASDAFKITTGSSPSAGTTAVSITTAGIVTLPAGPLDVPSGGTGATSLTDHGVLVGSGTGAITPLTVGTNGQLLVGSSAADPVFATVSSSDSLLTLTGGAGTLDIVANNAVAAASTLTDNLVVRGDGGTRGVQTSTVSITDSGQMTNTSQPAFLAYLGSTDSNQTGDGTGFTLGDTDVGTAFTEVYDQGSNFTTGSSSGATFTAPVTGKYYLHMHVKLSSIGAAHTNCSLTISTSNRNYNGGSISPAAARASANNLHLDLFCVADMDTNDTATFSVTVFNSTKTVGIEGAANPVTYVEGYLVC